MNKAYTLPSVRRCYQCAALHLPVLPVRSPCSSVPDFSVCRKRVPRASTAHSVQILRQASLRPIDNQVISLRCSARAIPPPDSAPDPVAVSRPSPASFSSNSSFHIDDPHRSLTQAPGGDGDDIKRLGDVRPGPSVQDPSALRFIPFSFHPVIHRVLNHLCALFF